MKAAPATWATCGLTLERAALAFINGVVVALASNGAFDAMKEKAE